MPREPPTTSTWPAEYLLSCGERRGIWARISGVTSRCSVSAASRPMSATATSPALKRPGATARPTLGPCIVTVTSARTAAPATSPVDAFTPLRAEQLARDAPVAAVRAASCVEHDPPRVREAAHELVRDRRSRALH